MLRRSFALFVTAADIESKLRAADALAPLRDVKIDDISGGCGSFFKVQVESPAFQGKSMLQQHRLVHEVLKKEIAEIHGITVVSKVPPAE
uniref:BolA-like protein n=1 Tax=Neobodo designis TaxID=312471 RepID=A0A7S1PLD1_NEODS